MTARTKFAGLCLLALLACATTMAGVAWAKEKPKLILKTPDEGKKGGTEVPAGPLHAGWYASVGEHGFCQLIRDEETETEAEFRTKEGSLTLAANGGTKADVATGSIATPACFEVVEAKFVPATTFTLTGGGLKKQEMTVKGKGVMEFASSLKLAVGACKYEEKKTKVKSTWPPKYATVEPEEKEEKEAFPFLEDTANLVANLKMKAAKGNAKTCPKSEEVALEAWLGPLGEEYEADLT